MSYAQGGSFGGKPEKNPNAAVWLKYADDKLYEAIDDQGILGILRPRFGSTMTFLYPSESSYRDKIIEKLNGPDATLGVNMVQALVIREHLADAADWLEKKDNIPNALGQKVELSPESSNKNVILSNGATLTLRKDFTSRDDNIAVWDYKGKAEMPLDGKPAAFVKRANNPKKRSTNRTIGGNVLSVTPHKALLARRLQDQSLHLMKDSLETFANSNPFTAACVSLLSYLSSSNSANLEKFNMMCEPNSVATFYAVVMPYTTSSILESDIQNWLTNTRAICFDSNPNQTWSDHVKKLGDLGSKMHEQALQSKSNMEGNLIKTEGENIYKALFSSDWKHRVKGDEMRFMINAAMGSKNIKPSDLSQLFLDIEILYSPDPKGNDNGSFFFVSSKENPFFLQTATMFVASRCFVSIPNPQPCTDKNEGIEQQAISFDEAFNSATNIEPTTHLITDDEHYLSQRSTTAGSDFVSGLKNVLKGLPADQKELLLKELSS